MQNAYIESFNGKLRDACLHGHWCLSQCHARAIAERGRQDYNGARPHSALGNLTPGQFAQQTNGNIRVELS